MKYSIVYSSSTGNTALLAKAVKEALPEDTCTYFGSLDSEKVKQSDIIFLGFWTDKGSCDDTVTKFLSNITSKKVFLFGTAGFGGQPEYFKKILNSVKDKTPKDNEIIGSYMCQGKMPSSVRSRYEKMLASAPENKQMQSMIENFDLALSHPNEEDLQGLKQAVIKAV